MNETELQRYSRLKAQIRAGVFLSRDDFLFVKGIDQRFNARIARSVRMSHTGGSDRTVIGGFNTAKK